MILFQRTKIRGAEEQYADFSGERIQIPETMFSGGFLCCSGKFKFEMEKVVKEC
jgi:hypothetical protein